MNRMKVKYQNEVAPALMKAFSLNNVMEIPRIEKVVVNIGLGEARENPKALEAATSDLMTITGQKPIQTKARKSIANFKLREGQIIGTKVTLRGERMWDFVDRLLNVALPRVRDFRGVSPKIGWSRKLHPGSAGPAGLPGDRIRQNRQIARTRDHDRDHVQV